MVETPEGPLRFVDTAGMRRKSRTEEGTEYFAMVRALEALDRADVALLVIDATDGVTHQDQRLAERIGASGSPVVVVLNKWELVAAEDRPEVLADVDDRLAFLGDVAGAEGQRPTGLGVHQILPALARPWRPTTGGSRPASSTGPSSPSRRPTRRRGADPLRRAGGHRPAHLHAVRQRPAAAHLPALRGARAPRALRPRPDARSSSGFGPREGVGAEARR